MGHPLYKYGLKPYEFFEVKNSDWIKNLIEMNRVHYNHNDEYFDKCRHFVYSFKDSCFEIICNSYSYEIINTSINEAVIEKLRYKNN
jgi:hypothetical protein